MKKILTAIQLFLIVVILAAAAAVFFYFFQTGESKKETEEIRAQIIENSPDDSEDGLYAENGMLKKYAALYEKNNDLRGWIKIDGTAVDYPVLQASDNDFYIHRSFYKEYLYGGVPFMDFQCGTNPRSDNIIIYGHNMKNGTMFAGLSSFENKDFFAHHKTVRFDTLYSEDSYEIAAVFYVQPGNFSYHTVIDFKDDAAFNKFAQTVKKLSLYDTNVTLMPTDKLLTLSTCAYHSKNERLVIVAKKL